MRENYRAPSLSFRRERSESIRARCGEDRRAGHARQRSSHPRRGALRRTLVSLAKRVHSSCALRALSWIPASAGMTTLFHSRRAACASYNPRLTREGRRALRTILVSPAKGACPASCALRALFWIPASAGMTTLFHSRRAACASYNPRLTREGGVRFVQPSSHPRRRVPTLVARSARCPGSPPPRG
jgi:hypothetical protein